MSKNKKREFKTSVISLILALDIILVITSGYAIHTVGSYVRFWDVVNAVTTVAFVVLTYIWCKYFIRIVKRKINNFLKSTNN
jgi:hypothetical protein